MYVSNFSLAKTALVNLSFFGQDYDKWGLYQSPFINHIRLKTILPRTLSYSKVDMVTKQSVIKLYVQVISFRFMTLLTILGGWFSVTNQEWI